MEKLNIWPDLCKGDGTYVKFQKCRKIIMVKKYFFYAELILLAILILLSVNLSISHL